MLKEVTVTGKEIGRGAIGRVFEVKYRGTKCAAKEIHPMLMQMAEESGVKRYKDRVLRQCQLLSKCLHPNIIQFIGIYYPKQNDEVNIPTMVMELMDCSLTRFIEKTDDTIPLNTTLSILHDVSQGVCFLHSRSPPVMHCDLSPNNVLVNTSSMVAKIAGFGSAVEGTKGDVALPGTMHFMPPEVLSMQSLYDLPLDVFSYGGVALYTVVREWPTPSDQVRFDPKTGKRVALSEVERRQQYLNKMIGDVKVLRPLVEQCLSNDPDKRPTIEIVSERIKEIKKFSAPKPR